MRTALVLVALTACTSIDGGSETHGILPDAMEIGCVAIGGTCTVDGADGICGTGLFDTTTCYALALPGGRCADTRLHPAVVDGVGVCRW